MTQTPEGRAGLALLLAAALLLVVLVDTFPRKYRTPLLGGLVGLQVVLLGGLCL